MMCLISECKIKESEYLVSIFKNRYALEIANNITHYRHEHINSYNAAGGTRSYNWHAQSAYADKALRGKTWEDFKAEINNRAKRQIARAISKSNMQKEEKLNYITEILRMQDNEEATTKLVFKLRKKIIGGR